MIPANNYRFTSREWHTLYWHDESNASALQGLPPIDTWATASNGKSDSQVSCDLVPDLKKLTAPVLIIEGKDDLITPLFEQEVFNKYSALPSRHLRTKRAFPLYRRAGQVPRRGDRFPPAVNDPDCLDRGAPKSGRQLWNAVPTRPFDE